MHNLHAMACCVYCLRLLSFNSVLSSLWLCFAPLTRLCGCCNKIAEAEAAVSVHEKKWLVMHMHVQLDELRGPPNPWLTVT